MIVDAGPAAVERFLEFFAAPLHVPACIRPHPGSVPERQAAPRRDPGALRLARRPPVLPSNPAASVRGPKHVVTKGATPLLTPVRGRRCRRGLLVVNAKLDKVVGRVDELARTLTTHVNTPGLHR